jgi:hypothetical protein
VAAWVFFSVLPNTPGLSNAINGSSFFTEETPVLSTNIISPVAPSKTNEEIVVSWLKD